MHPVNQETLRQRKGPILTPHSETYCNVLAKFLLHTKALAQIGLFVNEDFSRDNISKRHEHLQNVLVAKLLWKVVNKEVCPLWT
jgi:hypothetical protein